MAKCVTLVNSKAQGRGSRRQPFSHNSLVILGGFLFARLVRAGKIRGYGLGRNPLDRFSQR